MGDKSTMSDGHYRIRGGKLDPIVAIPDKSNECSPMEKACEADQDIVVQSLFLC